jgi:nicotinamidase-related amidase
MTRLEQSTAEPWEALQRASRVALIIVDMQNDFCSLGGASAREGNDLQDILAMVPRIHRLVSAARLAGVLTVWTLQTYLGGGRSESSVWRSLRARSRPGGGEISDDNLVPYTIHGSWGQEFVAGLSPRVDEPVILKYRSSAFFGTPLDLILRANAVETIALCGVSTQGCVESTGREAQFHDYRVALVADCVATTDGELQRVSLACQATRYPAVPSELVARAWADLPRETDFLASYPDRPPI